MANQEHVEKFVSDPEGRGYTVSEWEWDRMIEADHGENFTCVFCGNYLLTRAAVIRNIRTGKLRLIGLGCAEKHGVL